MNPFLGQIQSFGFDYAPHGWAKCDGQILIINQYKELYSLLGVEFGGDGQTTFALPDLRGRLSFGFSPLYPPLPPDVPALNIGQKGGTETVTLTTEQLPSHTHSVGTINDRPNQPKPGGGFLASPSSQAIYSDHKDPDIVLKDSTVLNNTGDQSHENMQPYLVVNWCIALYGTFPFRS